MSAEDSGIMLKGMGFKPIWGNPILWSTPNVSSCNLMILALCEDMDPQNLASGWHSLGMDARGCVPMGVI